MKKYTLEYKWANVKGIGTVTVETLGATEFNRLFVDTDEIGCFKRRIDKDANDGVTYSKKSGKQIGKGNLLAGLLFRFLIKPPKKK